ncbi:sperm acrosome membrane-associated protein 6-like isoform 2-T3 [Salvelinus alpinus]
MDPKASLFTLPHPPLTLHDHHVLCPHLTQERLWKLKEILNAEIMAAEFDKKMNDVYDEGLLTAADNFIVAAFNLPQASGCFPPCCE